MDYLARFSPVTAIRDLRVFLSYRQRHELIFFALAVVITALIVAGFIHDSHEPVPYKRDIIYVQSWPANRSEAEILAQQQIDKKVKDKEIAEQKAREKKLQDEFKKIDDGMKAWGL